MLFSYKVRYINENSNKASTDTSIGIAVANTYGDCANKIVNKYGFIEIEDITISFISTNDIIECKESSVEDIRETENC